MSKKMWMYSTVAAVVVTSTVWLIICKQKNKHQKKLAVVSEAGYETAYDIHYPLKPRKSRRSPYP
ncbi:MAG TPA: hypothetical protein VG738_10485 [Chitinophagaceae bacterium]|nr:hypothetical protein [Chitinophagaceae bacterium]